MGQKGPAEDRPQQSRSTGENPDLSKLEMASARPATPSQSGAQSKSNALDFSEGAIGVTFEEIGLRLSGRSQRSKELFSAAAPALKEKTEVSFKFTDKGGAAVEKPLEINYGAFIVCHDVIAVTIGRVPGDQRLFVLKSQTLDKTWHTFNDLHSPDEKK